MEQTGISKRVVALLLIGIILIAGGMRLYGLDRQSLWYDEVVEGKDFEVLLNKVLHNSEKTPDVTPPLNPFFVYIMTKSFPGSDFALRIPALIFGLISVPLLYLLGRQLFNEKVGLIASFLLAISPFHIWYSQDARMYALQWMLSLISLIYFVRALEKPDTGNLAGYFISTEAVLYTHQFGIFLVLLQGMYIMITFRTIREHFLKWIAIFISLGLLYLPWLIYSLTSLINKAAGASPKPLDIRILAYTVYSYCAGFSIGPSLNELHFDISWTVIKPYIMVIGTLMTVYCVPFVIGMFSIRKDFSKLLLLLLILTIPILGALGLVIAKPDIAYNVRYTATAFFAFLLLIAKGLDDMTRFNTKIIFKMTGVILILCMTGFSAYAYTNYHFDKRYHKHNVRATSAHIMDNKAPKDIVLCIGNPGGVFDRYTGNPSFCHTFARTIINDKEMINVAMHKLAKGRKRLWLVLMSEWAPHVGKSNYYAKKWLDENYEEIVHLRKGPLEIANMHVYCFDLTKAKTWQ